ncbi:MULTISPECIES: phospholipase D-like domain-containing protein [unclassified Agarivorans]|uniref:phospholipase D-like domain-containing protein n=1 Tax=unclassified Agarivorans TaxID=2636026 RepID=UPI0026E41212|nr:MULTISPECIES: phospholipase D-like domain-containing protein [unclassified Agarivorans]MDO6685305.1 phospholipase D-like domain-containing protein [Agarivorans sp. 3_MG-2023]MDO6715523.1 phospholipase D-like domain-containing protein [Agarivorans sp. 2_MG-2023]
MIKYGRLILLLALLQACSAQRVVPDNAIDDSWTTKQLEDRRWRTADEQDQDYLKLASESKLPHQLASVKVVGSSTDEAIQSLAVKIHLIEQAEHSLDLAYYIYTPDLSGDAILGALCEAVKRGVDVRIMVDSLGSLSMEHGDLKGLIECAKKAGFVKARNGEVTKNRARVQAVVFNALTQSGSNANRRSHDKLLVVDGAYPEKAWIMTGGRNVSLHYYGLDHHGEPDPNAFKDLEVLIRPEPDADRKSSPAQLTEYYYSVLFSKPGNKKLSIVFPYTERMQISLDSLVELKASAAFANAYQSVASYLQQGFSPSTTRFAHELDNLNATDLVKHYSTNKKANANSISGILARVAYGDNDLKSIRVVSPYLFLQSDLFKDEGVLEKDLNTTLAWLEKDPERKIEIITNSVLTSDNFFTQAVIDMHTVPSMLMSKEMVELWLESDVAKHEQNPDFIASKEWQALVNHPRIFFYQLGRADAAALGGETYYGKLHAKFIVVDNFAFVGTTNLDFRSLLYNNEVGFFFEGSGIVNRLNQEFDLLQSQSSRWGSDEWLEMRNKVREQGGMKGYTSDSQRGIYKTLDKTGLKYQF